MPGMGLGCVAQSICVLSFFALGLASSKLADPLGFSESRLGESASTPNLEEITITAPKELLKDVPAIMCAGWRAGVHKDHPAVKQICLGVPTAENQGQKAPTCHTSCTKACAEEHAQGKKHPICDLAAKKLRAEAKRKRTEAQEWVGAFNATSATKIPVDTLSRDCENAFNHTSHKKHWWRKHTRREMIGLCLAKAKEKKKICATAKSGAHPLENSSYVGLVHAVHLLQS